MAQLRFNPMFWGNVLPLNPRTTPNTLELLLVAVAFASNIVQNLLEGLAVALFGKAAANVALPASTNLTDIARYLLEVMGFGKEKGTQLNGTSSCSASTRDARRTPRTHSCSASAFW